MNADFNVRMKIDVHTLCICTDDNYILTRDRMIMNSFIQPELKTINK